MNRRAITKTEFDAARGRITNDGRIKPADGAKLVGGIEPLLTPSEVAIALSVSERTVWAITKSGELKATRVGTRNVRYAPADVRAYIEKARGEHGLNEAAG